MAHGRKAKRMQTPQGGPAARKNGGQLAMGRATQQLQHEAQVIFTWLSTASTPNPQGVLPSRALKL